MTGRDVRVVYTKYDGSLHWHHTMRYLGEDDHGTWLGAAGGLITRKGDGPKVVIAEPQVLLFPRDAWWTANFNAAPASLDIYCDVCTPPRWPDPGEVTMADLDLDVLRRRGDQHVALVDGDEFAEHQRRYSYSPEVIRQAEAAADWLYAAITGGAEPFAGAYHAWLDQVL